MKKEIGNIIIYASLGYALAGAINQLPLEQIPSVFFITIIGTILRI